MKLAFARKSSTTQSAATILFLEQRSLPAFPRCPIAKFTPTHRVLQIARVVHSGLCGIVTVMQHAIDEKPYTEILAGRLVRKVSSRRRHAILQPRLAMLVARLAGERGDVGTEWRFYMRAGQPRTSLVPDIAFVAREQPPLSPDVAIEIRSPDDRIANVDWKMRAYLEIGGTLALDVLPECEEIRAFTRYGMKIFGHSDRFSCEAVPWLVFDVAEVFAGLRD
jgi:Uma2 family endonuclease